MTRGLLLATLLATGCAEPGGFKCNPDVPRQCVHDNGTYAVCVPETHRCAVMDRNCPSGYRYDTNAGNVAGQCVPQGVVIPPAPPDMATGDMAGGLEPAADMTVLDLAVSVAGPDASAPGSWTTYTVSGAPRLFGVWGSGPGDVYVVGGPQLAGGAGTILHSTGNNAWVPQGTMPVRPYTYTGIWGSGATDVYASYSSDSPSRSIGDGTWSANQTIPAGTGVQWNGIWGSGSSDIFMVGFGRGTILHSNGGGAWVKQFGGDSTMPALFGIWGSGASNVFAVGNSGTIWHSPGGGAWMTTGQTSGTSAGLLGIAGTPTASAIYVAGGDGSHGVILKSSGAGGTWTPQTITPATSRYLRSVWVSSNGAEVYVVGDGGTVLHSTGGSAFLPETSNPATTADLQFVWGSGADDVYAVGTGGTILHWAK